MKKASVGIKYQINTGLALLHVKLYQWTLASLPKWSIDTKVFEHVATKNSNIPDLQIFSVFLAYDEQKPVLPGRILVPVPSLIREVGLCLH